MNAQNARQIAAVLRSDGQPAVVILLMGRSFSAEDADAVVGQLMDLVLPGETDPVKKIHEAMTKLERLFDSHPEEALMLLLALQPKADDLYVHDVFHSIGVLQHQVTQRFTVALRGMPAFCTAADKEEMSQELAEAEIVLGLLALMCRELQDTQEPVFEISGCGLEWNTCVWVELSIVLEQLPEVLPALREGRPACLDFFEQGFQRIVHLEPASRTVRCLDRRTQEEIGRGHLALAELLESFRKLLVDFVSYAWMAFPEAASHPLFQEWQNTCLPEAG